MSELNLDKRFKTMALDHVIMMFVVAVVAVPGMVYDIMQEQSIAYSAIEQKKFLGNALMNAIAFSLYFNKDIFLGRSPAKRMLQLQVVDVKTGKPASPLKCLMRNITIIVWPIELIATFMNEQRRIGDFIAGTKLAVYESKAEEKEINWNAVAVAMIVSTLFIYLAMYLVITIT